jgi:DNA-binding beta-propeller fold protein YncE
VDPTGKFAYVTTLLPDNVSAYSIGANGVLTPVPGSPFAAGIAPVYVAVDPTGKFAYVTNLFDNNVSAYSIGANGALTPVPGSPFAAGIGPFGVAITPLVPFATSFAKLEIAKRGFVLGELFTLGAISNGINPLTQNLALQIGTFSVTIPAGSFEQKPNGRFDFKGGINDVKLKVQIVPLGNDIFTFNAEGKGVDLTGLTNPVTVVLTIGIDTGSTTVTAHSNKQH